MLAAAQAAGRDARNTSDRAFLGAVAALFAASVAGTIAWCESMSATAGMPMPGGWTMSMAWMRMPGQSSLAAAAAFLGMWTVMMAAMMLPSLVPMLLRYRAAVGRHGHPRLTVLVGAGYFSVWTLFGMVAWSVGVALAELEMQHPELARAVPTATGVIVLLAGVLQCSAWKTRSLACCRQGSTREGSQRVDAGSALRHGLRLGIQCARCCAGLTAILLALGVMDLRVMAAVTTAITAERLAPGGQRVARSIGVVSIAAALVLLARAAAVLVTARFAR